MKSGTLKTEALCFLRYAKQLDWVCTEGGRWSADVLGANDNSIVEVEVKVSKADLLAEFRNKQTKHEYYKHYTVWAPNYFYFMVPPELGPETVEVLREKFPKAGVLTYGFPSRRHGYRTRILKAAKRLHVQEPDPQFLRAIKRRSTSELCGMHIALDELPNMEISQVDEVKATILKAITDTIGLEEWEKLDYERPTLQDPSGRDVGPPPNRG